MLSFRYVERSILLCQYISYVVNMEKNNRKTLSGLWRLEVEVLHGALLHTLACV